MLNELMVYVEYPEGGYKIDCVEPTEENKADLQAKMIPDEQYQNIRMVEDADAWEQTVAELPTLWNEQVMAYAK